MRRKKPRDPVSDCFVLINAAGHWWSGRKWVPDLEMAKCWKDGPDPWADADTQAKRLRKRGTACGICYIQPREKPQRATKKRGNFVSNERTVPLIVRGWLESL